jgi:hypothetical protein
MLDLKHKHSDKCLLGVSNYELINDTIRCYGKLNFGDSFDVSYKIQDISETCQIYGKRPMVFTIFFTLFALSLVGFVLCVMFQEYSINNKLTSLTFAASLCMGFASAIYYKRIILKFYTLKDYRVAFGVRICKENAQFIELLDKVFKVDNKRSV